MLHHLSPKKLRPGKRTVALWARKKPSTLVVFVHGFGGDGVDTWLNFPELLLSSPKAAACDLVFYDYDSTSARADASAGMLERFLSGFLSDPAAFINESSARRLRQNNFHYRKILIVAHSLGAIVSRRALLLARRAELAWVKTAKLALYAPAHMGANALKVWLSGILGIGSGYSVLTVFEATLLHNFPSLQDLAPGCETLTRLRDDTAALLGKPGDGFLIASKVVLGEFDKIVEPYIFGSDPNPVVLAQLDHSEVCKPPRDTSEPMLELLKVLR